MDIEEIKADLKKRGEAKITEMMSSLMGNQDFLKTAGQVMKLMSEVQAVKAKGPQPLNQVMVTLDKEIEKINKRIGKLDKKLEKLKTTVTE